MGWTAGVWFPTKARDFSLFHSVQTGPEAHSASYPMGAGGSFPKGKAAGRETDHSSSFSAEVKNGGDIYALPHKFSWRGA
jgi:hypothetical protein